MEFKPYLRVVSYMLRFKKAVMLPNENFIIGAL